MKVAIRGIICAGLGVVAWMSIGVGVEAGTTVAEQSRQQCRAIESACRKQCAHKTNTCLRLCLTRQGCPSWS
jgi:hypothetical protein